VGSFVRVDGLNTYYVEAGQGPPVVLFHGASLGSCTDAWDRTLEPLASHGFRAIALDYPGYGLTDNPTDYTLAYRLRFLKGFLDALGLERAHLIGHSQGGSLACSLAFAHPDRIASVFVLGTATALPPLPGAGRQHAPDEPPAEPTLEDMRAIFEDNLYHRELITPAALEQRPRMSVGKNLEAARGRARAVEPPADPGVPPLWQRLHQLQVPLILVYGMQDRGKPAERAPLFRERYPTLNLRLVDHAGHLLQWDQPEQFVVIAAEFLTRAALSPAATATSR